MSIMMALCQLSYEFCIHSTAFCQTEETTMSERNTPDFWRLSLDTNIHNSFISSTNAVFQFDNRVNI